MTVKELKDYLNEHNIPDDVQINYCHGYLEYHFSGWVKRHDEPTNISKMNYLPNSKILILE